MLKNLKVLEFGTYWIDVDQKVLFSGQQEIPLPPKVFETLLVLVENMGRIVEKDELLSRIWPDSFVEEGSLARNVSILRKILGANSGEQQLIQTIPKRGYRFMAATASSSKSNGVRDDQGVEIVEEQKRLDAAFDVTAEEVNAIEVIPAVSPVLVLSRPIARLQSRPLLWRLSAAATVALAIGLGWFLKPEAPLPVMRLEMQVPPGEELAGLQCPIVALAPDGNQVAFIATHGDTTQLYLRNLESQVAKALPGTEGAFCTPFFSPDGLWLGFVADGRLNKISTTGGSPKVLTAISGISGAAWASDGTIWYAPGAREGLMKVSDEGGAAELATNPDAKRGEISHKWPDILPGGEGILFQVTFENEYKQRRTEIVAQDLRTGERRIIAQDGTYPHYVPTGHIVYLLDGVMMARPFDLNRLDVTRPAFPIIEDAMQSGQGAGQFGFSRSGSLAYVPGGVAAGLRKVVWVDRNGKEEDTAAPPRSYGLPRLSRDGRRIATSLEGSPKSSWIFDTSRETLTRASSDLLAQHPIWSLDGTRIAYSSMDNSRGVFWKSIGGSSPQERLTSSDYPQYPVSWSPDGQFLAMIELNPSTGMDIWILPMSGERRPKPFIRTSADESSPMISPDGHWMAYTSNESGRYEIYVQSFPSGGQKWQMSSAGGHDPLWARAGNELFYRNGGKMMSLRVQENPSFTAGQPTQLFEGRYFEPRAAGVPIGSYDGLYKSD